MKILKYSIILLTFAAFVFIGCSDKYQDPVTPNTSNEKTVTSLQKTTGPGAWIIEYDANHGYAYLDEESGFILTLGIIDPSEFCTGTLNFDLFSFKELLLPNSPDPNLRRLIRKITGEDISAYVWQFDSVPDNLITFLCDNQPKASGTAKFVSTDNDYYVVGGNNRNSLGSKANGILMGTDGKTYKLNLVYHTLVDKNDPSSLFKEILTIHLTQTGKK